MANISKGLLGMLGMVAIRALSSSNAISWSAVKKWVDGHSNPDDLNSGSAGGQLSRAPQRVFAEIRKERSSSGNIRVTAAIVFQGAQGPAFTRAWEGAKLDSALSKRFGDGNSFRVSL